MRKIDRTEEYVHQLRRKKYPCDNMGEKWWNSSEVLECLRQILEWGIFMTTILRALAGTLIIISDTIIKTVDPQVQDTIKTEYILVSLVTMIAIGYYTRGILHFKTRIFTICLAFSLLYSLIHVCRD